MQGPERPAFRLVNVTRARLRQSVIAIEMDECVHLAVEGRDAVEAGCRVILSRDQAARDLGGDLSRRQRG